jgi:general secretion pathway protein H
MNVRPCRCRGFTLIELMIVVALVAVAAGVVSLALSDPSSVQLEKEAARLSALLESARAESRASGLEVRWTPKGNADDGDFQFTGLPATDRRPTRWLGRGVSAEIIGAPQLRLGPEPLIGAQRVVLRLSNQRLDVATDGLGAFTVSAPEPKP